MQFKERFLSHKNTAMRLNALLSNYISETSFDSLSEALNIYLPLLSNDESSVAPDMDDLRADFLRWQFRWQDVPASQRPSSTGSLQ